MRPLLACLFVVVLLLALLFLAYSTRLSNERERRRQLYAKSGSFASEVQLTSVPQDVSGAYGYLP
jgi:hypothetical protein